eukprot:scaffold165777_cov33-Tisochrysis_lutea.AAC.1
MDLRGSAPPARSTGHKVAQEIAECLADPLAASPTCRPQPDPVRRACARMALRQRSTHPNARGVDC